MPTFKSQLVLEEQRQLYDTWRQALSAHVGTCSGWPARRALQLRSFGPLLPYISLFELDDRGNVRLRMAGSALRDVFCADPATALARSGEPGGYQTITDVLQTGKPAAGRAVGDRRKGALARHWMRLPLGTGETVEAVLGLDLRLNYARPAAWMRDQMAAAHAV